MAVLRPRRRVRGPAQLRIPGRLLRAGGQRPGRRGRHGPSPGLRRISVAPRGPWRRGAIASLRSRGAGKVEGNRPVGTSHDCGARKSSGRGLGREGRNPDRAGMVRRRRTVAHDRRRTPLVSSSRPASGSPPLGAAGSRSRRVDGRRRRSFVDADDACGREVAGSHGGSAGSGARAASTPTWPRTSAWTASISAGAAIWVVASGTVPGSGCSTAAARRWLMSLSPTIRPCRESSCTESAGRSDPGAADVRPPPALALAKEPWFIIFTVALQPGGRWSRPERLRLPVLLPHAASVNAPP